MEKNNKKNKKINDGRSTTSVSMAERISRFIDKRRWIVLASILVIGGGVIGFGIRSYLNEKREQNAKELLVGVEFSLRHKEYDIALEGGGGEIGALDFIKEYKNTNVVNLAHLYAAIAYFKREKKDEKAIEEDRRKALEHLEAFDTKDSFVQPLVWCRIGDIYYDQKMYDKALIYYKKAASHAPNKYTTPRYLFKIASVYESMEQYSEAKQYYARVYIEYPESDQVDIAKKNKSRVEALSVHRRER